MNTMVIEFMKMMKQSFCSFYTIMINTFDYNHDIKQSMMKRFIVHNHDDNDHDHDIENGGHSLLFDNENYNDHDDYDDGEMTTENNEESEAEYSDDCNSESTDGTTNTSIKTSLSYSNDDYNNEILKSNSQPESESESGSSLLLSKQQEYEKNLPNQTTITMCSLSANNNYDRQLIDNNNEWRTIFLGNNYDSPPELSFSSTSTSTSFMNG
ncbi:hypothetical protein DERF_011717 [Dermatophagoides farinae]|uniref:Uncharacterized protein n=1 Tax=Dermatophagoides farinae TaxID=6954 RepID=A0A922HVJ6_DERFA|nr:hypothetical protein DERF_011717 [Dermatophagoides farinae]